MMSIGSMSFLLSVQGCSKNELIYQSESDKILLINKGSTVYPPSGPTYEVPYDGVILSNKTFFELLEGETYVD